MTFSSYMGKADADFSAKRSLALVEICTSLSAVIDFYCPKQISFTHCLFSTRGFFHRRCPLIWVLLNLFPTARVK
jgi:hypothetical protein